MSNALASIKSFIRDEEGAAATEYAILLVVIAAAVAAAVQLFNIQGIFTSISTKITTFINGVTIK